MRKILHIIDSINIGGAEKLLCNTIPELTEYTHLIVTLFPSEDISLVPSNATHRCLNARKITELPLKRHLYKAILNAYQPDLVHSHLYFATLFAKGLTPSKIPFVFTQHFEFSKNAEKWYYRVAERVVSNKKQHGIAVSNAVLRDYVKTTSFKGKMQVIENFIPDTYFAAGNGKQISTISPLKLVALGNIKPIKNQKYILDAFQHLKDLDVSCDIYGEGDQKQVLEKRAGDSGLKVYFKGTIKDSSTILPQYDIFIMPSLTEGFPLALFEAMSSKLPVIVSDIPVFHEILEEKGNYIPLHDPAQLRPIIETYLQNRHLLQRDGEQMRSIALVKAGKEGYLKKLRALYSTIIKPVKS
jgi:glycosyltransferase involved in cell wall biosynthesis